MRSKRLVVLALLTVVMLVISACSAAAPGAVRPAAPAAGQAAGTAAAGATEAAAAGEFTTPHPILSDVKVREAIARCIDRDALINSVYDFLTPEERKALVMDSFLPKTHWAYGGPYDFPAFDPAKGKALLDEAGWKLPEGGSFREKDGAPLSLKFTTTNAAFRQTWSAVMIQQLADCGIQIVPTYAPGSWWFGDSTGLKRRDFELGAYAWVGQADPGGQTLYACNQIPLPTNNWTGQNYMGWCNEKASNGIVKANNTLNKDDRKAAYNAVQQEFAKDVVSIPLFQRAEAEAWVTKLEGHKTDPTEYPTANLQEWKLKDGGDTIVIALTQEPDNMNSVISTMAAQRNVAVPTGQLVTQYNYDYQPFIQKELSTLESGLAKNNDAAVKAGDFVWSKDGEKVKLDKGVKVFDSEGKEVEYDGASPLKMKQLTVTYNFNPITWNDGAPVSIDDAKLYYEKACDKDFGATSYITCDSIDSVKFAADGSLSYTVTYLPGVQTPTYFLAPLDFYPSHQKLADGRLLKDVPAKEWATLKEVAETPLAYGPYYVKEWQKGQSITLAKNPHWAGKVETPNVIFVIVGDTNQAVAQLLNGDVDFVEKSTLGAGAELKTVIEAAKKPAATVAYEISPSPTWEHLDINLFTK